MYKVILLTGAPGTGKTTLRNGLVQRILAMKAFDYGELLLRRKQIERIELSYEQLRTNSAAVITPMDVSSTDDWIVAEVSSLRSNNHTLIDSHALTREAYGFRAIPFGLSQCWRVTTGFETRLTWCRPTSIFRVPSATILAAWSISETTGGIHLEASTSGLRTIAVSTSMMCQDCGHALSVNKICETNTGGNRHAETHACPQRLPAPSRWPRV